MRAAKWSARRETAPYEVERSQKPLEATIRRILLFASFEEELVEVRTVNTHMAQRACLKLRRLVVVAGRVMHARAECNRVALQAKQVDIAAREQAGVCRAVRDVARGASLTARQTPACSRAAMST